MMFCFKPPEKQPKAKKEESPDKRWTRKGIFEAVKQPLSEEKSSDSSAKGKYANQHIIDITRGGTML